MGEKTLPEVIEVCKTAQKNIELHLEEVSSVTSKINQFKTDLDQLQKQRDDLEKIQQDAPGLMIAGQFTNDDFSENKRKLAELYSKIDDAQALLEIFEKKLDTDYPRRYADLNNKLHQNVTIVQTIKAQNLAAEIASKAGQEIKELLAILPKRSNNSLAYDELQDIGRWLAAAVIGGSYSSPLRLSTDESKSLVKDIHERLGINP